MNKIPKIKVKYYEKEIYDEIQKITYDGYEYYNAKYYVERYSPYFSSIVMNSLLQFLLILMMFSIFRRLFHIDIAYIFPNNYNWLWSIQLFLTISQFIYYTKNRVEVKKFSSAY